MKQLSNTQNVVRWLGLLGGATGIILALICVSAPAGVWAGLWDFRRGFSILRFVDSWGLWFVYSGLALMMLMLLTALISQPRQPFLKSGVFAAVGLALGVLAWMVPQSYRPTEGENIPAIHDITTNPESPLSFETIVALRGDSSNTLVYGGAPGMTPEKLAMLQREAYPQIVPQTYAESANDTYQRALQVVESLGWEIVSTDEARARIEAVDTTFWFRFKDDVVIDIDPYDGGSVLNARSISRVGRSDVGKNAARLRTFFEAMQLK
ncbi:DUF1499 domain-containing protein [Aurantivibrio plasticivorans]